MTDKKTRPDEAAHLRRQAEAVAREKTAPSLEDLDALSPEEIRKTLHELRVYQIELEMQNEELRRTQVELETARERYFDLYDLAPVGYVTLSEKGLILENNLTAAGLLGVTRGALFKQPISRFILKEDQDIYYRHHKQLIETGTLQVCDLRMVRHESRTANGKDLHESRTANGKDLNSGAGNSGAGEDGTEFWAHLTTTAVQDADSAPVCRVTLSDISAQKQAEIKLQYLSMHDALTGLNNRSYFEESMQRLEDGRQYPISILMADVDNLKRINDCYGHADGDRLLKRVAHLLTVSFRVEDVIARIGGDEFAILMPGTSALDAEGALLRFHRILQEHNAACAETPLQLSCGISTAEKRAPLIEVLKEADAKMYLEKEGRNVTFKQENT